MRGFDRARVLAVAAMFGLCGVLAAETDAQALPGSHALAWGHTQKSLKKAARRPPKDPEKALALAKTLLRAGLDSQAHVVAQSGVYRRAATPALRAELRLTVARSYIARDRYKKAVRECKHISSADSVALRHICLAEAFLLWKRATLALPEAKKALEADPGSYDAHVVQGRALMQGGKPKAAAKVLKAAHGLASGRYEANLALAEIHLHADRGRAALATLRKAHAADGEVPEVLVLLADSLPRKRPKEAERLARLALTIRPGMGPAHAVLGRILLRRGKFVEARSELLAALKFDPREASWTVSLGRVLLAQGKAGKALLRARGAQKLVKNDGAAKLLEADALAARGDIDLAIEAYEQAYGYARSNPAPLVSAARACLAGGRPTTGRAFADRAVQEFPKWAPAWEIAGDIAVVQKDRAAARGAYRKALKGKGPVNRAALKKKLARLGK